MSTPIETNTTELQELLAEANALPTANICYVSDLVPAAGVGKLGDLWLTPD